MNGGAKKNGDIFLFILDSGALGPIQVSQIVFAPPAMCVIGLRNKHGR